MCTAAYREALTRDLSSKASSAASSAPASAPTPSQRHATEAGREAVAGRPLRRVTNPGQDDLESRGVAAAAVGAVAGSAPAMTLAKDATVVNGEAIAQRCSHAREDQPMSAAATQEANRPCLPARDHRTR
jgi:hypothetical protein